MAVTNMTKKKVQKWESHHIIDMVFFVMLLCAVSYVMFVLFHHQTYGSNQVYESDMKAYILEMQGLDSGYSFPYPIFFKFAAFLNLFAAPEMSVAFATMIMNVLSMVLLKLYFNHEFLSKLQSAYPKLKWLQGIILSLLSASLLFVSMLYLPNNIYLPGLRFKYMGVFSGNPFHNATYMAARPFAILAFLWCVKLLKQYEVPSCEPGKNKLSTYSNHILFALFLLLATMTKPSFTIVLVGAVGLILVYRLIKSRFRNIIPTLLFGACFLPTFVDLLYQFRGVFVPKEGEEGGIGFCFGEVWSQYCDNYIFAILLAIGFPVVVFLCNFKEIKTNTLYRFSWQIYGMSFAMAYLLCEKGFRRYDFNFSWGYMYGIFFVFVGALQVLLQETSKKRRPILLAIQWLAFLAHVGCGIYYFLGVSQGNAYY